MKQKKFIIPLYEQLLTVVISDNLDALTEFTRKNDSGESFIALRSDIGLSPGLIAHECKHVINGMYHRLGIKLDPINDEPECYLLTWMVDAVWKFYNKQFK